MSQIMLGCLEGCAGVWKRRVTLARKRGHQSNHAPTGPPWTEWRFNPDTLPAREKRKTLFTIKRLKRKGAAPLSTATT
jgi:hypothetical protein